VIPLASLLRSLCRREAGGKEKESPRGMMGRGKGRSALSIFRLPNNTHLELLLGIVVLCNQSSCFVEKIKGDLFATSNQRVNPFSHYYNAKTERER